MKPSFAVTSGMDLASIDASTGELTINSDKTGNVVISVTVGNPGKETTLEKAVAVQNKLYKWDAINAASTTVDVSTLANYKEYYYRITC